MEINTDQTSYFQVLTSPYIISLPQSHPKEDSTPPHPPTTDENMEHSQQDQGNLILPISTEMKQRLVICAL